MAMQVAGVNTQYHHGILLESLHSFQIASRRSFGSEASSGTAFNDQ
jgi:hypothetical protein